MKKIIALLLALAMVFCFAACGNDNAQDNTAKTEESQTEETKSEGESSLTWKDIMDTVEREAGIRIVIFQNFVKFDESVSDFASFEKPEEKDNDSYTISQIKSVWTYGVNGDLKAFDVEGNETAVSVSDLETALVRIEEDGTGTLILGSKEVRNFRYLLSADNEMLLFVDPELIIPVKDIYPLIGKTEITNVFATASDGFWCMTSNPSETEGSEIRGLLSGAVNCNLTVEGKGGAGKINDIFYIDIID